MTAIRVSLRETRDASYDVIVGQDVLGSLPALLRERCPATRYAVIADHKVAELVWPRVSASLREARLEAVLLHFPPGEWNKSRGQWEELTDAMLAAHIGRDGAVVALGGGVAGDLAGFVAATYLRGIPWVQVPTSLLAMIDSSVGGKTGVDAPAGKNLVGAFHQPRFVLADVAVLATLPAAHVSAGMAEALKHGIIADADYFASLEDPAGCFARDADTLEAVVRRSVAIKAAVVSEDERESGRRQVLNFGHTIGHAIETLSGFDLLHGEAVAIGMTLEAALAERLGIAARGLGALVRQAVERYRLPAQAPAGIAPERILEAMRGDKKVRGGRIRFALPSRIGAMAQSDDGAWTVEIPDEEVLKAM
jgi:3-dehydroquinate synthase